ncbi:MAG: hypothetical protein AAGA23_20660 [Pseudomonadota bacterium]
MLQTLALNPGHFLLTIDGSRKTPLPAGDLDGNLLKDEADRDLFSQQFGLSPRRGNYNLLADLDRNRYVDRRDRDQFDGVLKSVKTAGPWMSGLWFNPDRDGEGFHLLVTDDSQAVVAWFTFGVDGRQAWLIGTANVVGSELIFDSVLITRGARFGPGFSAQDVVREHWGDLRIFFDDCDHGWVSYSGPSGFANGGHELSRLSTPMGVDCDAEAVLPTGDAGRYNGIWFDPEQDGAGWFVDQIAEDQAAITWFTYDPEGNQHWMIGVGAISDETITVDSMQQTSGARFGSDFDPSQVIRSNWGRIDLTAACDSGSLAYEAAVTGFGSGSQNIVPLARIAGQSCEERQTR